MKFIHDISLTCVCVVDINDNNFKKYFHTMYPSSTKKKIQTKFNKKKFWIEREWGWGQNSLMVDEKYECEDIHIEMREMKIVSEEIFHL